MTAYVVRRVITVIPFLLLLSVLTFALLELAPGDPAVKAAARSGTLPRAEDVAFYREMFHLDDPVHVRYLYWLGGVVQGDLGLSWDTREPISSVLLRTVPRSMLLVGLGFLIAWTFALVLGTLAGSRPTSAGTAVLDTVIAILVGMPVFVLALIALFLFSVHWQIFPTGGMVSTGSETTFGEVARHVALPAMVLGVSFFGWYTRVVAAGVTETRSRLFITTARAKGLPETLISRRHLLRPSLVPFINQVGSSLGALIGGAYAVEIVFSWPGIGRTAIRSAQIEDYPMVMALVLVTGTIVIFGNLLADIGVALVDPRVRLGRDRDY